MDAQTVPSVDDLLGQINDLEPLIRAESAICELRAYTRQRSSLVESAARCIQHMQKALNQMGLQLQHVLNDVTGVTGLAII